MLHEAVSILTIRVIPVNLTVILCFLSDACEMTHIFVRKKKMQHLRCKCGLAQHSQYSNLLRARRAGDWIPVGGETFHTCPEWPWGPPNLLYNGYQVFPGGTAAGGMALTTHPHVALRLKKEYSYTSTPHGPSRWKYWVKQYKFSHPSHEAPGICVCLTIMFKQLVLSLVYRCIMKVIICLNVWC